MTTILIAEDDLLLSEGLTQILSREGFRCVLARHGGEVQSLVGRHRPDLLILDVMMPRKDGLTVVQELRGQGEGLPVLMLTAKSQEADLVLGLGLGADDYLAKPFRIPELLARIRALLRRHGEVRRPADRMQWGTLVADFQRQVLSVGSRSVELSTHENALLRFLAHHAGALVTRAALLDAVWGDASAVTLRVVDFHITNLRRKLEQLTEEREPRRIVTVHGSGYKFVP